MPLPPVPAAPTAPVPPQTGTSWAVPPLQTKDTSGRRSGVLGRERN
jgi:hypothetical protein